MIYDIRLQLYEIPLRPLNFKIIQIQSCLDALILRHGLLHVIINLKGILT